MNVASLTFLVILALLPGSLQGARKDPMSDVLAKMGTEAIRMIASINHSFRRESHRATPAAAKEIQASSKSLTSCA